jgi:hypothetical protein
VWKVHMIYILGKNFKSSIQTYSIKLKCGKLKIENKNQKFICFVFLQTIKITSLDKFIQYTNYSHQQKHLMLVGKKCERSFKIKKRQIWNFPLAIDDGLQSPQTAIKVINLQITMTQNCTLKRWMNDNKSCGN